MQLNKHDIERLVAENQEESKTLEFKAGLYEDSRDGTKEFLKDVTAFANAQGGKLLIGIEEIKGADGFMVASSANGVAVSLDQFKQKWENKLRDNCDPPLNTVTIYAVDGFPQGRRIIVLDVPRSWIGPHRVRISEQSYFYLRTSSKAETMDSREIREAFLRSDSVLERLKRWRAERVGLISVDQGQVSLDGSSRAIVHVMPLESFYSSNTIRFEDPSQMSLPLALGRSGEQVRNFDGMLIADNETPRRAYCQTYRSGLHEGVNSSVGRSGKIAGQKWELIVVDFVQQCLEFLKRQENQSPVYIGLSLTGVLNSSFHADGSGHNRFDRDVLAAPEVELDPTSESANRPALRRSLDDAFAVIWESAGFARSPYMGDDGSWRVGN